jgi:transglutaminase-like putative cysteine protease
LKVQVRVGCEFVYDLRVPVHAVIQVEPRLDAHFSLRSEHWSSDPALASSRYIDAFGNLCRRADLPVGRSLLRYDAVAELPREADPTWPAAPEMRAGDLPNEALAFTLPSRLCPSDELAPAAFDLFGDVAPGWGRVQAINDWVHGEVGFGYGSSTPVTTAAEVLEARKGVCRDFAHLAITFCRALNIPARYAFGYLPDIEVKPLEDPMDFCAWVEVFLGGAWWTFDPRNNQRRIGRVLIGRGRDALDVAMLTTFGAAPLQTMLVWADELMR